MKKINKKGFTMIELLAVLVLISLVFTIAMPGLLKMRDKMYERALNHKKDIITKAAIVYIQDNSNYIKHYFEDDSSASPPIIAENVFEVPLGGESISAYVQTRDSGDYIIKANAEYIAKKLVSEGELEETFYNSTESCKINNDDVERINDPNLCLDSKEVTITLSEKYKTVKVSWST